MFLKIIFLTIVLHSMRHAVKAANIPYILEFSNFTCQSLSTTLKIYDCSINKVEANLYAFSGQLMFDKDLEKNFVIRLKLDTSKPKSSTNVRLLDVKVNACDALAQSFPNPLIKGVLDEIMRTSNAPSKCPLKGDVLYKMDNFHFGMKNLPIYLLRQMDFIFTLEFLEEGKVFGIAKATGSLVAA